MIFHDNAPLYWAAGLPAIPLKCRQKAPAINGWNAFSNSMSSQDQQQDWLLAYPNGNIGLPLGPEAGILAVDLDTDDQIVVDTLNRMLPFTPFTRVGKKGSIRVFKYSGERTFRIKDALGKTLVEVLSRGSQMVLPPSIHPDTQRPYTADSNLWEVVDQLVPLPAGFEKLLRQALEAGGIKLSGGGAIKVTDWVPAGGRDSALVSMAGLQARGVIRGERTLIEAMNEMDAYVANFTEQVVGDAMAPEKGRAKLMEFLARDVVEGRKLLPTGWDSGLSAEDAAKARECFGQDFEEWPLGQFFEHIAKSFLDLPESDPVARNFAIDDVLKRAARSTHLSHLDQESILHCLHNVANRQVSVATLRKRMLELSSDGLKGADHTEISKALLEFIARDGEVLYSGSFFQQWTGSHWARLADERVLKEIAENFGHLPAAKRSSDHNGILQITRKLAQGEMGASAIKGINFANGYLTPELELLTHQPSLGANYVLPRRWMPSASAPVKFLGVLDQCWGSDPDYADKIQALREAMAATLFGVATRYQRAICLYGVAASGKSTILDIAFAMAPQGVRSAVAPHEWGDKFMPSQLAGALINHCGELSESRKIAGNLFKLIVEGSEITGQFKGRDLFLFRPVCAHWFAGNHLPLSLDGSEGFNRRWLFLEFPRQVPYAERRVGIAEEIIAEEGEEILAWALPAISDLAQNQGYTLPKSHAKLVSEMANRSNSVRHFLSDGPVIVANDVPLTGMSGGQLYPLYYSFHCRHHGGQVGRRPVDLSKFKTIVHDLQGEFGLIIESGSANDWAIMNIRKMD